MDCSFALARLPLTRFEDSGGSNGWLAEPDWLDEFVASLELGTIFYRVLRMLPAGQGIPPHVDKVALNPGVHGGLRYHVPLVTHPDVLMRWPRDGVTMHLEAGWLYLFDHTREHEVVNRAPVERIHLVVNGR